jgi:hypothetical protein
MNGIEDLNPGPSHIDSVSDSARQELINNIPGIPLDV